MILLLFFLVIVCFFREISQKSRTFISFCRYWSHVTELAKVPSALFPTYRKFQIVSINFMIFHEQLSLLQWIENLEGTTAI